MVCTNFSEDQEVCRGCDEFFNHRELGSVFELELTSHATHILGGNGEGRVGGEGFGRGGRGGGLGIVGRCGGVHWSFSMYGERYLLLVTCFYEAFVVLSLLKCSHSWFMFLFQRF
jgi:hypothetical protein